MPTDRRRFLGALAAPAFAANPRGANDRIRVALVGLRGRGRDLVRGFHEIAASQNVELAAFCDVNAGLLRERANDFGKLSGKTPQMVDDMRRVMDDKNIDAIAFATPNHWHALGTIWACQAGKDVYCEKPASHNIWEGRQMVAAARKYGRMVQVGSQMGVSYMGGNEMQSEGAGRLAGLATASLGGPQGAIAYGVSTVASDVGSISASYVSATGRGADGKPKMTTSQFLGDVGRSYAYYFGRYFGW